MLHFELCYYRLIERAIERRCTLFEAGAQGEHKLKRGLAPAFTHSAHWIRHQGLAAAVARLRRARSRRRRRRRWPTTPATHRSAPPATAT